MSEARWYATSTALATGTASGSPQLVLSGSKDLSLDFFGGLRNDETEPRDRGLFRYGIGHNGHKEDAMYSGSGPEWPTPRRGHTMVRKGAWRMFGGRDSVLYFDEYWTLGRGNNTFGADFDYKWEKVNVQGLKPPARWGHSAVATTDTAAEMIIFGGIKKVEGDSIATDDVWRLWFDNNPQVRKYRWTQVTIQGSPSPGARCGHVAFYHRASRRMLVFGGRDSPTGTPSDNALWALNFNAAFDTATWQKLSAVGPSPRYDHAGVYDTTWVHPDTTTHIDSTYAFVFGGQLASGKSNELWQLRISPDTTWQEVGWVGGTPPSPRSGHTLNSVGRLLYVFGGRPADDTVYVAHMEVNHDGEQRTWVPFNRHAPALTGQAAFVEDVQWARVPEIYDPAATGQRWTRLENAPKFLNWYPQVFVCAADTVFVAGPDVLSYKLWLSGQKWIQFPGTSSGFLGGSAVMYKPGMVMKCGSRDIEGGGDAVGTTKRIDLNAGGAAQWDSSAVRMKPRVNHNLVLLPNGQVMAVGGTAKGDGTLPQYRPEIWDPDVNGGIGAWYGGDMLAAQQRIRDYHSTAVLLPCGRILSAGGNVLNAQDLDVEILCPPYLFNTDGSAAARPGLVEAPRLVRYGAQHTLCRTSSDSITKVSLIRPGATTHGFDQNQRFVPLSFTTGSGPPPQLTVTFPASPVEAPPGDYLLFVLNAQGVPSIANWVRLVSTDDVTAPAAVGDLERDLSTQHAVNLTWVAPGDDNMTGTATQVDLRYSQSPITADNFCQATPVSPAPAPGSGGTGRSLWVTGLQSCHTYYFAMKYWDEVNNVGVFGNTVEATTTCGCCILDERAHFGREGTTSAHDGGRVEGPARTAATAAGASSVGGATGLVVEATPGRNGLDLRVFALADDFEGYAVASDVLLQWPDGSGGWRNQLGYDLLPDSRFALCVPEKPTRWVFMAPCAVAGVLPAVGGARAAWRLDSARHSTLGDVTAVLADSVPGLGAGDTLVVHYAAAPDTGQLSKGWMVIINRSGATSASVRAGRRGSPESAALPIACALYQSQPNPFAEKATIRFALAAGTRVKLEVFDLLGRKVRTLADRRYEAGEHEVTWDRHTMRGALASPGLYFYRIEAGEFRAKRALMIVP